jgi:hypothetical protein
MRHEDTSKVLTRGLAGRVRGHRVRTLLKLTDLVRSLTLKDSTYWTMIVPSFFAMISRRKRFLGPLIVKRAAESVAP